MSDEVSAEEAREILRGAVFGASIQRAYARACGNEMRAQEYRSHADDLDLAASLARTVITLRWRHAAEVAAARREGAEAMREACDAALDDEERRHRSAERSVKATLEERAAAWERGAAVESARAALAALPLPGEEVSR